MSALNPNVAPQVAEYAGDEVSALVLDAGSSTVRVGFAGEDTPKSIVPTSYGELEGKQIFGDHVIDLPKPNLEIKNPMNKDGLVEDWDVAERLWRYSFASKLTGQRPNRALQDWLNDPSQVPNLTQAMKDAVETEKALEDHPLFMTEASWNTSKGKDKAIEIAMENWGTPAFYMGKTGVMAAFASGKATALIIDIGAKVTSVTPVHDGLILKKGVTRSSLAGNFLSSQIRAMLATRTNPITITPHYMVKSKTPVDLDQPANFIARTFDVAPQPSFRRYQEERTIQEFKECVVQVWPGGQPLMQQVNGNQTQEDLLKGLPGRPFEFPDGFNSAFTSERYRVAEALFDTRAYIEPADPEDKQNFPAPTTSQTLPALIKTALQNIDVDLRPHLLSNVVVTGGTSLVHGLNDRLNAELVKMYPSSRIKLHSPGNLAERKFGSWIGGSIMASLGTFHQMWISKKEYEEHGPGIVEKRCK
ncbi:putative chromatin remodeling and histone acetyltransferase complexes subunit [Phaeomoniella chlamydospora]|uniref:Actin-related protein 4 n=1 Tax=Phaeomoniella chlamydospora TaxID=158046 RepID=A0A0G2E387_PHACM|nr:putative chromatin remodeling and histone acetyltransferase complexes subunit [Phaeomoniella chlamydospora]